MIITNTYVAVLPTLLTIGNFVCGLLSIVFCVQSIYWSGSSVVEGPIKENILFQSACLMIFFGMIFDMLDGYIARATNSQSKLGGELDSLADICTFGISPSVILITMWIRAMPTTAEWWSFALVSGIIFSSCAMLRLAIYNTTISTDAKPYFHGLPSPAAAGIVVSSVLFFTQNYISSLWTKYYNIYLGEFIGNLGYPGRNTSQIVSVYIFSVFTILIGLLMVSNFKFAHVANLWVSRAKKLNIFILVLFVALLLGVEKSRNVALFIGFVGYLSLCLFINIRNILIGKRELTNSEMTKYINIGDGDDAENSGQ